MRADRLIAMVLLLRQRGQLSAQALAEELEVSVRTVHRDFEALSSAGVPVYAERGRHGGYALLPGLRTELTGLHDDEALALFTAGRGEIFGLGGALTSAMRKLVDALPERQRATADQLAARFLVEPDTDLLARRRTDETISEAVMGPVRRAVVDSRKLRLHYEASGRPAAWRTVDPIGLVTVRGVGYLLALSAGSDRTYRLSRILSAAALPEPADRPEAVDLERIWQERSARFRAGGDLLTVQLRLKSARRPDLVATAVAVHAETVDAEGTLRFEVSFHDRAHAEWALWQWGLDVEVLDPPELRHTLRDRAAAVAAHHS